MINIQEAQEYSREHGLIQRDDGDDIMLAQARYDAIGVIEDALDNGYQLCKVDQVEQDVKNRIKKYINEDNSCLDITDLSADIINIIKKACE